MDDLLSWFKLKSVPGIGNHLFKRLIDRFGSPERVFEASEKGLLEVDGMTARLAKSIRGHRTPDSVKTDLDLLSRKNYAIVTLANGDYPPLLREIPDPPPFLYVHGNLDIAIKNIAVVGSRNATDYGLSTARRLSTDLASLDFNIISGMAKGIDTAAHRGALAGRGKTVAVLGSGLERIYPSENVKLFHQITERGAVVSEFPLMTEPEGHNFPRRNRIISGMCLGTVVVEATKRSGALITARLALEQNREVFAVPGNVHSFKSMGTHSLIKEGAKLIEHAWDIVEELPAKTGTPGAVDTSVKTESKDVHPPLSSEESTVFGTLGPYPVHIDDLVRKLAMDPGKLSSILLQLELKGMISQSPGKLFTAEVP